MTPKEKLEDLRNLRVAIKSERDSLFRLACHRGYRKKRLSNVIERIRSLRLALMQSMKELLLIRGATNGTLAARIEQFDKRTAELDAAILHAEQAVRIERLLKIRAQMEALGLTPEQLADMMAHDGDPDAIDEDVILS